MKFRIHYGNYVSKESQVIEADSLEDAEKWAYELAWEVSDSYVGLHGFCDFDEVAEEEGWSEEELNEAINEEIESNLEFWAEEVDGNEDD